jgi:hypothetical protein
LRLQFRLNRTVAPIVRGRATDPAKGEGCVEDAILVEQILREQPKLDAFGDRDRRVEIDDVEIALFERRAERHGALDI